VAQLWFGQQFERTAFLLQQRIRPQNGQNDSHND